MLIMNSADTTNKLAQSASALGAALLGFGIGAKWGAVFNNAVVLVTLLTGAFIHTAGMYVMQMKEQSHASTIARLLWVSAWICLLALAGLFIFMAIG
jgi:hypothetical protein